MIKLNELDDYDEMFEYWKDNQSKTTLCEYAIWSGGSGYIGFDHCSLNTDVRYGCKQCPENCNFFNYCSESTLMSRFNTTLSKPFIEYLREEMRER